MTVSEASLHPESGSWTRCNYSPGLLTSLCSRSLPCDSWAGGRLLAVTCPPWNLFWPIARRSRDRCQLQAWGPWSCAHFSCVAEKSCSTVVGPGGRFAPSGNSVGSGKQDELSQPYPVSGGQGCCWPSGMGVGGRSAHLEVLAELCSSPRFLGTVHSFAPSRCWRSPFLDWCPLPPPPKPETQPLQIPF